MGEIATEHVYAEDANGVRRLIAAPGDEIPATVPTVGLHTPQYETSEDEPYPGYDELPEDEVLELLPQLDADALAKAQAYERAHQARGSITTYGHEQQVLDTPQREAPAPAAAEPPAATETHEPPPPAAEPQEAPQAPEATGETPEQPSGQDAPEQPQEAAQEPSGAPTGDTPPDPGAEEAPAAAEAAAEQPAEPPAAAETDETKEPSGEKADDAPKSRRRGRRK